MKKWLLALALSAGLVSTGNAADINRLKTFTGTASQWPWQLNTDGTWTSKQPAFSDIAGSVTADQMPAFTGGDCTTSAGSVVLSCTKTNGNLLVSVLTPKVDNNTALSALASTYATSVVRLGFAAAGDAPPVLYTRSNSACSLNAGAGDGASQVPHTASGHCWLASVPSDGYDIRQFGADPTFERDSLPAINAALATGKNVVAPTGTYRISFSTTTTADDTGWISMNTPGQLLSCRGSVEFKVVRPPQQISSFTGSISGTTLTSTNGSLQIGYTISGAGVSNLTLVASAASGSGPYTYTVSNSQTVSSETMTAGKAYSATPALVVSAGAVGAKIDGCSFNQDAFVNNFASSAFAPMNASDQIVYVPGVGVYFNPLAKTSVNDAGASTALIMADDVSIRGSEFKHGHDNALMIGVYSFSGATWSQSQGPIGVRLENIKTSYGGEGIRSWTPNLRLGCGIDVATSIKTKIVNADDFYSSVGFCVDEGGGASADMTNLTSYYAQMAPAPFTTAGKMSPYYPLLADPWHGSTISGSGFFFGGSNRSPSTGQAQDKYVSSTCTNCTAFEPAGVGMWFSRFSNASRIVNPVIYKPGLECFFAVGGTHQIDSAVCDQPNAAKGLYPFPAWSAYPWPAVAAVAVHPANDVAFTTSNSSGTGSQPVAFQTGVGGTIAVFSPDQINTTLNFNGLKVTGPSSLDTPSTPNWNYTLLSYPAYTTGAAGTASAAAINVYNADLQAGSAGMTYQNTGSPIFIQSSQKFAAPTLTGTCTGGTVATGSGARSGTITFSSACAAGTLFLNFPYTGPNGWQCARIYDVTTPANSILITQLGAYFVKATATITAGDTLAYAGCEPY